MVRDINMVVHSVTSSHSCCDEILVEVTGKACDCLESPDRDEGEEEVSDGEEEVSDGEEEVSDGQQDVSDGEEDVSDGEEEYPGDVQEDITTLIFKNGKVKASKVSESHATITLTYDVTTATKFPVKQLRAIHFSKQGDLAGWGRFFVRVSIV